jgi:hypothetical protein
MNRARSMASVFLHRGERGCVMAFGLLLIASCTPRSVTIGAFGQVDRIEGLLSRGVSTPADVQRVLGTPTGSGGAIVTTDGEPREVWFYGDIQAGNIRTEPGRLMYMDVRQRTLLVFFHRGVFDGFMWYDYSGTAETH